MSTIVITLSEKRGVEAVVAKGVSSVAEANRVGRLNQAIALPISLLDRTIREFAAKEAEVAT